MRRRIVLSVSVLTLVSALGGAGGFDARSAAPANDFVLASFFDQYNTHFWVNAWSGPAGENPQGLVKVALFPKARVDCLVVHGREALVIADIPKWFFVITLLLRDVRRGPDEVVFIDARQGSSPDECPTFDGTDGNPGTQVSGDINVYDAR
jgi:hypothetical protein